MNNTIKTLLISSLFAVSSFSQETETAYIPVVTNVAAKVSIQPNSTSFGTGTEQNLAAGVEKTLEILLKVTAPLQDIENPDNTEDPNDQNPTLPQSQIKSSAAVRYERGRVFIELNPSFKNADISLFSLNGKQVLHGKAYGSESLNLSQSNISEGIYLLLVKGSGSNSQSARIMHRGGTLNINATFSGGVNSQSVSAALAKAGDYGTWTITATANGYIDTSYAFQPDAGTNNPLQTITLRPLTPLTPEPMTAKSALQYFKEEGLKVGWNLGNTLDAATTWTTPIVAGETAWGNPLATQELFNGVKESGFDIVRIPVSWMGHIGSAPDYKVSETRLKRVAEVVNMVHNAGMKAIINIHHDGNYTDPSQGTWGFVKFAEVLRGTATQATVEDQLGKVWTQIAEYFKNYGDYLIFETLNEIHSGNWGSDYNYDPSYINYSYANEQNLLFAWNTIALNAIRATGGNNATRFVAVPGLGATEPDIVIDAYESGKLLPDDGANGTDKLIVAVHFYYPSQYTVADATPTQSEGGLKHTLEDYELASIATEIGHLKTTFTDNGIAVYFGEWGAPTSLRSTMSQAIKDTHIDYIRRVATAAHENGVVPIYWDCGQDIGMKILNRTNGKPTAGFLTEVLEAIMTAVNAPLPPTDIEGNLGNYKFGQTDTEPPQPNYEIAQWSLSYENVILAQTDGAKLVLQLTNAPTADMVLVWQNASTLNYWQSADIFKAGEFTSDSVEWDEVTKTLTITLNEDTIDDYEDSFKTQISLTLLIGYWSGSSVNDLGITSANLEFED